MPTYKSYCWSLGTTSFRMVEFNRKIELQLRLLKQFWDLPDYRNLNWSSNNAIQTAYYNYIREQGFIEDKEAPRKDKDAREKTSGLVDLGLIDDERRLTQSGRALLDIAESGDFNGENILRLAADSFIYFKQLLKLSCPFDNQNVRPYVILAFILSQLGEISKEEFTYLLPLAISQEKTERIVALIHEIRYGTATIDEAIISILNEMENYQEAQELLLNETVTETLIMEIGMNRKSREYDRPYFSIYNALWTFAQEANAAGANSIFNAIKNLKGKCSALWRQYIFNTSLSSKIQREGASTVNNVPLFRCENEREFKKEFFRLLHLFKAKSLLSDYYDLNKRYFRTSDTILFQDERVKFDIVPACYFSIVKDNLLEIAFTQAHNLHLNCDLNEIGNGFNVSQEQIFTKIEELYGVHVRNLYDIQNFVDAERYERLNRMIDTRFTDEVLIELLDMFENRDDANIQNLVTNNADVPTIFEYILAITWYKISGRRGNVLDYMNLSLDADLLPITHAAGGHEDITYKYEATENYPAHTLLIEATLASSTNQRRMEMEPVSRHLGEYLLKHPEEAYCLFATTYLHVNVVSDFRNRKTSYYYSADGTNNVFGMKIIPCNTAELKTIIQCGITYAQLYRIFEEAYQSTVAPNVWYQEEIKNKL